MANSDHYARLCAGAASWNVWRSANPSIFPNLDGLEPPAGQRRFCESNGSPVNLSASLLRQANLSHAILIEADLTSARLNGADLRSADLTRAIFDDADVGGALFGGAIVNGASLHGAKNLTQEQIDVASGDGKTTLPPGLIAPKAWLARGRDLYLALCVMPSANEDEIKAAYRVLAKRVHPDRNPSASETKDFKEIALGVALLLDPRSRKRYDRGDIDSSGQMTDAGIARRRRARLMKSSALYFSIPLIVSATAIAAVQLSADRLAPRGDEAQARIDRISPHPRAVESRRDNATVETGAQPIITGSIPSWPLPAIERSLPAVEQCALLEEGLADFAAAPPVAPPPAKQSLSPAEAVATMEVSETPFANAKRGSRLLPLITIVMLSKKRTLQPQSATRSKPIDRRQFALAAAVAKPRKGPRKYEPVGLPFERAPCALTPACRRNEEMCGC